MGWTRSSYFALQNNSSAPHCQKLSLLYEPIYTIDTIILSRVWALRATWMSYSMIPRDWAIHIYIHTYVNYQRLIKLDLSTPVFQGWAMGYYRWAISWSVRRVQNHDTSVRRLQNHGKDRYQRGGIAFDLTFIGLRRSVFNPTIDKLQDRAVLFSDNSTSLARYLFGTTNHFFI